MIECCAEPAPTLWESRPALSCLFSGILQAVIWFTFIVIYLRHQDIRIPFTAILMASMKYTRPTFKLNEAETLLLSMAARLLTALRYKEANPGGDFSHFAGKIKEEIVCHGHISHS